MDLIISIENNRLETNLFIKPSNKQLYLDFYSNHPDPCKEGIIYGQALRVIERCSKTEDTDSHLENLKSKLKSRNYPEDLVDKKISVARKKSRQSLIQQNRHDKSMKNDKIRLIFTHNRGNPPLHKWVREAKQHLVKDDKAKALGDNIQICYRQPQNLKSLVTHQRKPCSIENSPGCSKCGRCRVSCPVMVEGEKFTSTNTKKTYKIRQKLNCDSSFIIYLVTCKKCGGQYVGKSQTPFKKGHSNHKQEIKNKIGGLGHHYGGNSCKYENLSVQLIDQVEVGDKSTLAEKEVYWQNQLRCYVQNGGNAHCYRKEK